jgi:hypothetical protein
MSIFKKNGIRMKEDKCIIRIIETCKSKGKIFEVGTVLELIEILGEELKVKFIKDKEQFIINKKYTNLK